MDAKLIIHNFNLGKIKLNLESKSISTKKEYSDKKIRKKSLRNLSEKNLNEYNKNNNYSLKKISIKRNIIRKKNLNEFNIILPNKKEIKTININSFSLPEEKKENNNKSLKLNYNLPPLYRNKKLKKSISTRNIKSSVSTINIILDDNYVSDEIKNKTSIEYIIDLINEKKKYLIENEEEDFNEEQFEKQRIILEYFDKLPETILNIIHNQINYYNNNYFENDIITNNMNQIFQTPKIKFKFFENIIDSITHKVNFIDFNTKDSYEKNVINIINNEFNKLISTGNKSIEVNLSSNENNINQSNNLSINKFIKKYDSLNSENKINSENKTYDNFHKKKLHNNNNKTYTSILYNKNNEEKKKEIKIFKKNEKNEIINLLNKEISPLIMEKLKKEEKQKFEEMNETRKKIELEKKKYDKIKEEKLEIIKSRNYDKTKMIKSNSNPYLKEKINKSKLINYSMNGKKINKNKKLNNFNKERTKTTLINSIDNSNENNKKISVFKNYNNEILLKNNSTKTKKEKEFFNRNNKLIKSYNNINLINNYVQKKNKNDIEEKNFSKDKTNEKTINKNSSNFNEKHNEITNKENSISKKLNNENEIKQKKLDLLLKKILKEKEKEDKEIELKKKLEEKKEKENLKNTLEEKDNSIKTLEKENLNKSLEKENLNKSLEDNLNETFDRLRKIQSLFLRKISVISKKPKSKSFEINDYEKKNSFNQKLNENIGNYSFEKSNNLNKRKSEIKIKKIQYLENEEKINKENNVIQNSKLNEFKRKIIKMKKIDIQTYLSYLKENYILNQLTNEENSSEKRINRFIRKLNDDLNSTHKIYNYLSSKCKVIDKKVIIKSSNLLSNIN